MATTHPLSARSSNWLRCGRCYSLASFSENTRLERRTSASSSCWSVRCPSNLAATSMRPHWTTIELMVVSTLFVAISVVLAKHAYRETGFWGVTLLISLGAAAGTVAALVLAANRRAVLREVISLPKGVLAAVVTAESLNLGFEVLYLRAVSKGPVGLVSVTEGVQPAALVIGGAVLSRNLPALFNEPYDVRTLCKRLGGAGVVVAGLVLLR